MCTVSVMTNTATRTDIPTVVVECSCTHCAVYAEAHNLTLPLRAEVNVSMAAKCATRKGRHNLVQIAVAPPFGLPAATQAKFGPWAVG